MASFVLVVQEYCITRIVSKPLTYLFSQYHIVAWRFNGCIAIIQVQSHSTNVFYGNFVRAMIIRCTKEHSANFYVLTWFTQWD